MRGFWSSLVGKGGARSSVSLHINTNSGRSDYKINSTVKKNTEHDDSGLKVAKPGTDSYVQSYIFNIGKGSSNAKLVAFDPVGYTGGDYENVVSKSYNKNADVSIQAPCFISKEDKDEIIKDKAKDSVAILKYEEGDKTNYVLLPSEINNGELKVLGKKFATVKKEQESLTAVKIDHAAGISEMSKGVGRW